MLQELFGGRRPSSFCYAFGLPVPVATDLLWCAQLRCAAFVVLCAVTRSVTVVAVLPLLRNTTAKLLTTYRKQVLNAAWQMRENPIGSKVLQHRDDTPARFGHNVVHELTSSETSFTKIITREARRACRGLGEIVARLLGVTVLGRCIERLARLPALSEYSWSRGFATAVTALLQAVRPTGDATSDDPLATIYALGGLSRAQIVVDVVCPRWIRAGWFALLEPMLPIAELQRADRAATREALAAARRSASVRDLVLWQVADECIHLAAIATYFVGLDAFRFALSGIRGPKERVKRQVALELQSRHVTHALVGVCLRIVATGVCAVVLPAIVRTVRPSRDGPELLFWSSCVGTLIAA
jgi:hypothetical protein